MVQLVPSRYAPFLALGILTLAIFSAVYGYLRASLNYLGFGTWDGGSIGLSAASLLVLILCNGWFNGVGFLKGSPSLSTRWVMGQAFMGSLLLAIGSWYIGSPLDPNRIPASIVFGFSGIWIGVLGAGLPLRRELRHWNVLVLIGFVCFLSLFLILRAKSVDGRGRPMMGWTWEKKPTIPLMSNEIESNSKQEERDSKLINGTASTLPGERFLGESWPQLMGRNRDGVGSPMFADSSSVDPKALQFRWEVPVGPSWSGCIVEKDVLYTQEASGDNEQLVAMQLRDGRRIWTKQLSKSFSSNIGGDGSRATPSLSGNKLVALSGIGELVCFNTTDGAEQWRHNILRDADAEALTHGVCGSPLIVEGKVYLFPGGKKGYGLLAYDLETGELLLHGGDIKSSYSSLMYFESQPPMIIASGKEFTAGFSLDLAREFWRYEFTNSTETICSQPQRLSDSELLLCAAYGTGARKLRLKAPDEPNGEWKVEEVWKSRHLRCNFSSVVVSGNRAFGLDDGILQCVDLRDGKSLWKKPRYGYGQLLLCGSVLLVQCEDGSLAAVHAESDSLQEYFRIPQLDGKTWNHPTWSRPYLLLRNDSKIRCLRIDVQVR